MDLLRASPCSLSTLLAHIYPSIDPALKNSASHNLKVHLKKLLEDGKIGLRKTSEGEEYHWKY